MISQGTWPRDRHSAEKLLSSPLATSSPLVSPTLRHPRTCTDSPLWFGKHTYSHLSLALRYHEYGYVLPTPLFGISLRSGSSIALLGDSITRLSLLSEDAKLFRSSMYRSSDTNFDVVSVVAVYNLARKPWDWLDNKEVTLSKRSQQVAMLFLHSGARVDDQHASHKKENLQREIYKYFSW